MIRIKDVNVEDATKLLYMIKGLGKDLGESTALVTKKKIIHSIRHNMEANYLFLYYEDEAIGYALCSFIHSGLTSEKGMYISNVYISPPHRGKGHGNRSMKMLHDFAREQRCTFVELHSESRCDSFYKTLGYTVDTKYTLKTKQI